MATSKTNTKSKKKTEVNEEAPQFQPHFEYDEWEEAGSQSGTDGRRPFVTKGFDMFATKGSFYIVRSDLDRPLYMRVDNLHNPKSKGKIYDLPENFQNGDHYFGDNGRKYVIRGNILHGASDMSTDVAPMSDPFDPDKMLSGNSLIKEELCSGMHYLNHKGKLYMIDTKYARQVSKLGEGGKVTDTYGLNEKLMNGLCYFALGDYIYVVKYIDIGGGTMALCYYQVKSFGEDPGVNFLTVSQSIQLFMPGGYTIDRPASRAWESIGSFTNKADIAAKYSLKFKYTHGSSKTETKTLENHWDVSFKESAGVSVLVAKASASSKQKYGGSFTETSTDQWKESTEETISFEVKLEPDESWALWQPVIKLGGEKTLVAGKEVTSTSGKAPTTAPYV